ncbi:hypothetical protein GCM10010106_41700 [Thermopolyspora flexuosa]|uniref:non-specific serine/threonine protein kinase n=1 Tax=Thermopolyspora flexuosa TaxID=103836 RepID=A0A543IUP2_9ACTN|nr:serine/threonine-protein kinase [Thermopolyspora flexuosa]TQM74277.1 serine/threonine protein kinase [Thermopolyspora flexuosa]GGM89879.1 hypothetical protein GCM10010106_41700 [Thermopolyspora flexuosa]
MGRAHPLRPGDPERVGDYEVLGLLGEGGQGTVLLGRSPSGQRVAIKLLRAEFSQDPDARKRFLRESEVMQRVAPFCTVRVLDAGVTAYEQPYIVSEYVEGESLEQLVRRDGPRTGSGLSRLAVATLTALSAIHRAGIVHQDFKPSNVLMGPEGPVVIDFGIARVLDTTGTVSQVVGTPSFMSPEQVEGKGIGPASDMFSWAATMVFAATGRLVFHGNTIPAILHNVIHAEPDLTGVPDPLRIFVSDCLAKDPRQRPSAKKVLSAITGEIPVLPREPVNPGGPGPQGTKVLTGELGAPPVPHTGPAAPAPPAPGPVPPQAPPPGPMPRPAPGPVPNPMTAPPRATGPGPHPGPTVPPPAPPPGPVRAPAPPPSRPPAYPPPGPPRAPVPPPPGPAGRVTVPSPQPSGGSGCGRGVLFAIIGFVAVLVMIPFLYGLLRGAGDDEDGTRRGGGPAAIGTYTIDATVATTPTWDVRFTRMRVTSSSVILTVRYRNRSSEPQTLVCDHATGGTYLRLSDGTRVPPSRTPCSSRVGDEWQVAARRTYVGTAVFPIRGRAGTTFTVNWFNWGVSEKITIPDD